MKDIMNQVISRLTTKKGKYCRLRHKRGWLEFLQDGDLVFTPSELHEALRQVIGIKGNRPKGKKLFTLRKKEAFTAKADKTPYRPEEALERFIVISNLDKFYNQIPIGGRKESIDIGIEENDSRFIFVELKPWKSANSPLYALVESLKNLIEYRMIHEFQIKEIPRYDELELCILAPKEYYREYSLLDSHKTYPEDKLSVLKKTLDSISSEFQVDLSLMALELEMSDFLASCRKLYDRTGLAGQCEVSVSKQDPIPSLARAKWRLLVDSG